MQIPTHNFQVGDRVRWLPKNSLAAPYYGNEGEIVSIHTNMCIKVRFDEDTWMHANGYNGRDGYPMYPEIGCYNLEIVEYSSTIEEPDESMYDDLI